MYTKKKIISIKLRIKLKLQLNNSPVLGIRYTINIYHMGYNL